MINQQLDAKYSKQFPSKIWVQKEHNKKAEWIDNKEKELQVFEDIPEVDVHLVSYRPTVKKC